MAYRKQALTIASSDSSGGAGIQADIKAMEANGVFALSVIVAATAQNTKEITDVYPLPQEIIEAQIDAVFDDFKIDGIKTGMLYSAEIVKWVSAKLRAHRVQNLVVDPVMLSKRGRALLQADAIEQAKSDLFPLARLITPNIDEAQRLAHLSIITLEDAREAARRLHRLGCASVLVKGGHLKGKPGADILYDGKTFTQMEGDFIRTPHTHGTGCTYSAAIAAHLALGKDLVEAVGAAKVYITEAIRHGLSIGHGQGPTDPLYALKQK